ncbi:hypothetical protein Tco_1388147, partial [Tanacetum coccineum]
MSGTIPPIPPPLGTNNGNPTSLNRTDPIPVDITNNTTTTNVAQNVNIFLDGNIGLVAESFDWDEKSVSSKDEGVTKVKAFMAIAKEEPSVRKNDANEKGRLEEKLAQRKNTISLKEVLFSKAAESLSETALEITSDSESECDIHEPLPHLSKLLGAEPNDTSKDEIFLADLTLTPTVSKEIKKVPAKRSTIKVLKKKDQPVTSSVPDLSLVKKADSSTKKLLLTLMEE